MVGGGLLVAGAVHGMGRTAGLGEHRVIRAQAVDLGRGREAEVLSSTGHALLGVVLAIRACSVLAELLARCKRTGADHVDVLLVAALTRRGKHHRRQTEAGRTDVCALCAGMQCSHGKLLVGLRRGAV